MERIVRQETPRKKNPNTISKQGIRCASTRNLEPSRKVICQGGQKKCLWSDLSNRAHQSSPTKISEWDGTPLKDTFYKQDLQKVNVDESDLFRVEKIVKRKGTKVLVRWKGWPVKYDSWIEKHQLKSLR